MRLIDSHEMHRRARMLRARALNAFLRGLLLRASGALRGFAGRLAAGFKLAA